MLRHTKFSANVSLGINLLVQKTKQNNFTSLANHAATCKVLKDIIKNLLFANLSVQTHAWMFHGSVLNNLIKQKKHSSENSKAQGLRH